MSCKSISVNVITVAFVTQKFLGTCFLENLPRYVTFLFLDIMCILHEPTKHLLASKVCIFSNFFSCANMFLILFQLHICHDHLPMTCFNLHSVGTVLDHKYHWIYLYEKQRQDNKLYLLLERKYGLKLAAEINM